MLSNNRRREMAKKPEEKKVEVKEQKPYCYHVCYQGLKNGMSNLCSSVIYRDHMIDSEAEVGDLVAFLMQANEFTVVIPITWTPLLRDWPK
jgi:hypothetical protein